MLTSQHHRLPSRQFLFKWIHHSLPKVPQCSWARKQTRCRQLPRRLPAVYRLQGSKTMDKSSSSERRSWTLTLVEMTFSTHSSLLPRWNLISPYSADLVNRMLPKRKLHQANSKRSTVIPSSWARQPLQVHLIRPTYLQARITRYQTNKPRNAYVNLEIEKQFRVPISKTMTLITQRCSHDSRRWQEPRRYRRTWCLVQVRVQQGVEASRQCSQELPAVYKGPLHH